MSAGASVIEAMLLRWGDSPTGRTVTFLLPEDDAQHPFKGLKTGPSNGQRLALSVALIADDETQHEVPAGKSFAQRAGILCGQKAFHRFLSEAHMLETLEAIAGQTEDDDDEAAAIALRKICGVASRSDLIDGTPAGRKFIELERDFNLWMRGDE